MRARTLLTFTTGAAAGAGAMYLLDPDHGAARRREARRGAWQQARRRTAGLATDLWHRSGELAGAAAEGYVRGRAGEPLAPPARRSLLRLLAG